MMTMHQIERLEGRRYRYICGVQSKGEFGREMGAWMSDDVTCNDCLRMLNLEPKEQAPAPSTMSPMKLTACDRCDRCGAQAYVKVETPGGGELLFCAHHADQVEMGLMTKGCMIVVDDRKLLRPV